MTEQTSGEGPSASPVIGYYVHHHGVGHRSRYETVAPLLHDVVAISELEIAGGLVLPTDVPTSAAVDPEADGALHWAPLHLGAAARLHTLTDWLASRQPRGVVVDVSVEAALACRLAGVPTVVVRQLGCRDDRAHDLGYRVASRLVAPWPEALDDDVPRWIRDKTHYVGYLRADANTSCPADDRPDEVHVGSADVVVLWGRGGGRMSRHALNSIAAACHGTVWCVGEDVVERNSRPGLAPNVVVLGWRTDIDAILHRSPVVVASAGNNTIASAARWSCPLVLLPQHRPFAEQQVHARRLATLGAAVLVDDADGEQGWSARFAEARDRSAHLGTLYEAGGARRFADAVDDAFACQVNR